MLTRVEGSPLLGGRGAFVMGKANYKGKTAFVIPGVRGGWLLAQVAILIPKGLCVSLDPRASDEFPGSNYFLQVILPIKVGPDSSDQEPVHV